MKTFINVAQMKLATLQAGQFVETGGDVTKGDGGQARYLVTAGASPDNSVSPDLANGNHALYQGVGAVNDLSQSYEFLTLDDAVISTIAFPVGKVITLKERITGNGGGAMWDVVLSTSVTENGYNIVQCTGVPTLSLVLRQGVELYFSANELGLVADYEAGNTDQSTYLNAMIVAVFGSNAGILTFDGEFYFNGDVDYRNVGFDGLDKNTNRMFFDGAFGMLSTTPSQQAPTHKNLKLFSATERTANGQTLLSLLGKNYPRLSDVLIFGGENALLIEDGASVESHYGVFNSIDISRSHHGIRVRGGNRTQSHTFNGGRIWDCVESYVNMEGTADINFVGTQFEGDRAAQHLNAGASPDDAETKFYGCRDECDSYPDIQVGALLEDGVYWSGNKMPATQSVTSTEATELPNQIMIQGVRDDVAPTGINILRNPNFDVDPSDLNEVPAWVHLSGNVHEVQKGAFGNIVHIRGVNATERTAIFKQDGISVRKGWYTWGGTYERTGATSTFTTQLTLDGVALTAGVDFEGVAVNTTGTGKRINRIKFLRDIENIRFEFRVAAVNDADDLYYQQPFLVIGRHSQKTQIKNPLGFISASARATPITGWFNQGDVVYNLLPTELGSASSKYIVDGWKRIVTGNAHVLNTDWVELRVPTGN